MGPPLDDGLVKVVGATALHPVNQPLEDVANRFLVGATGDNRTSVVRGALLYRLTKQDALNLCAWLSVVADLSDEELIAARRQVEST